MRAGDACKRREREGSLARAVKIESELNDRASAHQTYAQRVAKILSAELAQERSQGYSQEPGHSSQGSTQPLIGDLREPLTHLLSSLDALIKLTEDER